MNHTRILKRKRNKTRKVGGVNIIDDMDVVQPNNPPLLQGTLLSNVIEPEEGNTIPSIGINAIGNPDTEIIPQLDPIYVDPINPSIITTDGNMQSLLDRIYLSYATQHNLIRSINNFLRHIRREYVFEYPALIQITPQIQTLYREDTYSSLIKMEENTDYVVSLIRLTINRQNAQSALRIYRFIMSNIYPIFIKSDKSINSYYLLGSRLRNTMNRGSLYHRQVYNDLTSRYYYEQGIFVSLSKLIEINLTIPVRFPIADYPQEHADDDEENEI